MRHAASLCTLGAIAVALFAAPNARADDGPPPAFPRVILGDQLGPEHLGPGIVEDMATAVARRDARLALEADRTTPDGPKPGVWAIPTERGLRYPHSGRRNVTNKYGDRSMGIGFPTPVDVRGAWFSVEVNPQVTTSGLRVRGYRAGDEVARTDWFRGITTEPRWFAMDLTGVDRIVFEAEPVINGAGWYAMDDLTYVRPSTETGVDETVVIDFEDARFRQVLTGSDYRGLTWETGAGDYTIDDPVHAPIQSPDEAAGANADDEGEEEDAGAPAAFGGAASPTRVSSFQGVIRGDAGSFSFPPDSNGAVGPDHYVITVNRNFAVYDKTSGAELTNMLLGDFLPGSNGDPRVLYDQYSDRWIVLVTDFSATTAIFLAVSTSDDAMGTWFKTSFITGIDADAGCWPDYPTLGLDEDGIYTASNMIGCSLSIFAIEKAPLIAASPSLGVVTAFRGLPNEAAIQPTHSFDTPGRAFFVSRGGPTSIRVRELVGPITAPSLVESGFVAIPNHDPPPDIPALGSPTPLDHTVSHRLMNAVYRNGSIWTIHDIEINTRSAVRWYEIDANSLTTNQVGTIADNELYLGYGAIGVNAQNDVAVGFSGANENRFASAYFTGRNGSDPPGTTGDIILYRSGSGSYSLIDGFGRNRWGDYSLTTVDPDNDLTFWTIQEYAHDVDVWGTYVAELEPMLPTLTFAYPDGRPAFLDPAGDTIRVTIAGANGGVLDPASPALHYDLGGGFVTAPLTPLGGDDFEAVFPSITCGTNVAYFFSAETTTGEGRNDPAGAPAGTYGAVAALGQLIAFTDDLETDAGWITENLGATSGDWQRGVPVDDPNWDYDPPFDGDGSGQAFLTQNEVGNTDVDNGAVRLTSPPIDVSEPTATLRYRYFLRLTNTDGTDRLLVEASDSGVGGPWVTVNTHATDGGLEWRTGSTTYDELVAAGLTPGTDLRLRFTANDGDAQSIVEAGVDGFEVERLDCGATGLAGDTDNDGDVDFTDLLTVLAAWGPCPAPPAPCPADVDGDGIVGFNDVLVVLSGWTA